jgi:hypothetical protein
MAHVAVAGDFTVRPPLGVRRTIRRIQAILRLRRIERGHRRTVRLVLSETNDARTLADAGIDGRCCSRRQERFEMMAVAVGARWSGG